MSKKLLMIVSGPSKHGKSTSLKYLAEKLIKDKSFRGLYPAYDIENAKRHYQLSTLSDWQWDKGDWTVSFYKREGDEPSGYIVTAGDYYSESLEKTYKQIFEDTAPDFVIAASRVRNDVYRELIRRGTAQDFIVVKISSDYIETATKEGLKKKYENFAGELMKIFMWFRMNVLK